jgi:hypothetical protein
MSQYVGNELGIRPAGTRGKLPHGWRWAQHESDLPGNPYAGRHAVFDGYDGPISCSVQMDRDRLPVPGRWGCPVINHSCNGSQSVEVTEAKMEVLKQACRIARRWANELTSPLGG